MKYSREQIEEAFKKMLVCNDQTLGVEIVYKPEEGEWFKKFVDDFFKGMDELYPTNRQ